jgi:hypothetical protein
MQRVDAIGGRAPEPGVTGTLAPRNASIPTGSTSNLTAALDAPSVPIKDAIKVDYFAGDPGGRWTDEEDAGRTNANGRR